MKWYKDRPTDSMYDCICLRKNGKTIICDYWKDVDRFATNNGSLIKPECIVCYTTLKDIGDDAKNHGSEIKA